MVQKICALETEVNKLRIMTGTFEMEESTFNYYDDKENDLGTTDKHVNSILKKSGSRNMDGGKVLKNSNSESAFQTKTKKTLRFDEDSLMRKGLMSNSTPNVMESGRDASTGGDGEEEEYGDGVDFDDFGDEDDEPGLGLEGFDDFEDYEAGEEEERGEEEVEEPAKVNFHQLGLEPEETVEDDKIGTEEQSGDGNDIKQLDEEPVEAGVEAMPEPVNSGSEKETDRKEVIRIEESDNRATGEGEGEETRRKSQDHSAEEEEDGDSRDFDQQRSGISTDRRTTFTDVGKDGKFRLRFLHEFLILGLGEKIREAISTYPTLNVIRYRLSHLLSYPENFDEPHKDQISDFVNPFDEHKYYSDFEPTPEGFKALFEGGRPNRDRLFYLCLNSRYSINNVDEELPEIDEDSEMILNKFNPNRFYYYFCMDVSDFIFKPDKNGPTLDYFEAPKIICFKTLFPRKEFYFDILTKIYEFICQQRVEISSHMSYAQLSETLLPFESEETLSKPQDFATMVIHDMMSTQITLETFNSIYFPMIAQTYYLELPDITQSDYAWHIEGDNGIDEVLHVVALEEVLYIFFCLLNEVSIIFVSENMHNLSSCICFFSSLIKPFHWVYPNLYSLPEKLLGILQSPLPFIAGVKLSMEKFVEICEPKLQEGQKNKLVVLFIDDHKIQTKNMFAEDILVPSFNRAVYSFKKKYEKMHRLKKSRFIRFEKKKSKGIETFRFHTRSKPDKKSKTQKVKPDAVSIVLKYEYQAFFYRLLRVHIENILKKNKATILANGPENIDLEEVQNLLTSFTEEDSDKKFLVEVTKTQFFQFHLERKL